jgi:hypothetical protein
LWTLMVMVLLWVVLRVLWVVLLVLVEASRLHQ